jgi:hypothetical protein
MGSSRAKAGLTGSEPCSAELRDGGVLTKTGNRYKYSDEERNIHEREVALWEINPEGGSDAISAGAERETEWTRTMSL